MQARAGIARLTGRRRLWVALLVAAVAIVLLALVLRALLQPERVTELALRQVGNALGLEITAAGIGEYRLRGTPTLVVRDMVARAPGVATPVLTADRVLLSLPWSTLRARVSELDLARIELDAPVLDLDALQAWRATRPPAETRIPTLRKGLQVTDGTLVAQGWRIERFHLALPWLHAQREVRGSAQGRYRDGDTTVPFDVRLALERPATDSALGLAGNVVVQRPGWRIPAYMKVSGILQLGGRQAGAGGWGIARMKLAANARYENDTTRAPFAFGLAAALRQAGGRLSLAPAGVALRVPATDADNPIPGLDAHGALALEQALELRLEGTLAGWPLAWPALPPPLGQSDAPLPFALHYVGDASLADAVDLHLQRDGSRFDGRLRLPDVTAWLDEEGRLSPLPPLDGRATVPRMEVVGATLEGVEITLDDPDLGAPAAGNTDGDDATPGDG